MISKKKLNDIISAITVHNNCYRDPNRTVGQKLDALWEIGEVLVNKGVKKPHSVGWKVQEETKGLIKRPTIFRSHKIRTIWAKKSNMQKDIGGIKKLSYLIEMLPLIDPAQEVRNKMKNEELQNVFRLSELNNTKEFKDFLQKLKNKYAHGQLGKHLDKAKHLAPLEHIVNIYASFQKELLLLFKEENKERRAEVVNDLVVDECRAFSNMCLSLTTKNNYRLYKKLGPAESGSKNKDFKYLYNYFKDILKPNSEKERARLRRLISAEAFAQLSDMITSIRSEDLVKDFRSRQKLSIGLR